MTINGLHRACTASVLTVLLSTISVAAAGQDVRLIDAVKAGDRAAVHSLLKRRVDVNAAQPDGGTALAWAAHRGDAEVVDLLIRAGANPNAANELGATPLFLASVNGTGVIVDRLLKAGAHASTALPSGETALMAASRAGSTSAVTSLLGHKADVNAAEKRRGQTALMWAVANRHAEVARVLIAHGADVRARSAKGYTPLLFAAQEGDLSCVEVLLEGGADINDVTTPGGATGGDTEATASRAAGFSFNRRAEGVTPGMTPLLIAAARGHGDLARFLLENGADPNAADEDGITALHWSFIRALSIIAAAYEPLAINAPIFRPNMTGLVKVLVERGANVNARMRKHWVTPAGLDAAGDSQRFYSAGATPFLLATTTLDLEMMRYLLAHGANPHITTEKGATTLHAASGTADNADRNPVDRTKGLEAAKMLLELGIDVNAVGDFGFTALHGASYNGDDAMVKLLVDHGARMDIMDELGGTPLSIAMGVVTTGVKAFNMRVRTAHPGTADLLVKLGAPSLEQSGVEAVVVGKNDARPEEGKTTPGKSNPAPGGRSPTTRPVRPPGL